ncbi:MAG: hypothetical protein IT290_04290 [Deltaproteobacteria bacterium]|nr:hypothetical protein [Deltaproteobacteria bacterium]
MSSRIVPLFALMLGVLVLSAAQEARASFLRMQPTVTVTVQDSAQAVQIRFSIRNEGDEAAVDVGVEIPSLNEAFFLSPKLMNGQEAEIEMNIPAEKLRLGMPGRYRVPYRVTYKDLNQYRFSSPSSFEIVLPPAPGEVLTAKQFGASEPAPIRLARETSTSFTIVNIAETPITVNEIRGLTAAEIIMVPAFPKLPFELKPRESFDLSLDLRNVSALIDSSYLSFFVVSGVSGDKHFAELFTFQLQIVNETENARMFLGLLLSGVVIVTFFMLRQQRRRR